MTTFKSVDIKSLVLMLLSIFNNFVTVRGTLVRVSSQNLLLRKIRVCVSSLGEFRLHCLYRLQEGRYARKTIYLCNQITVCMLLLLPMYIMREKILHTVLVNPCLLLGTGCTR